MKTTLRKQIKKAKLTYDDLEIVLAAMLSNNDRTFRDMVRAIRDVRDMTDTAERNTLTERMLDLERDLDPDFVSDERRSAKG